MRLVEQDFYFEEVNIIGHVSGTVVEIPLDPYVRLITTYEEGLRLGDRYSYIQAPDTMRVTAIDVKLLEDSPHLLRVTRVDTGPTPEEFCDCGIHG